MEALTSMYYDKLQYVIQVITDQGLHFETYTQTYEVTACVEWMYFD